LNLLQAWGAAAAGRGHWPAAGRHPLIHRRAGAHGAGCGWLNTRLARRPCGCAGRTTHPTSPDGLETHLGPLQTFSCTRWRLILCVGCGGGPAIWGKRAHAGGIGRSLWPEPVVVHSTPRTEVRGALTTVAAGNPRRHGSAWWKGIGQRIALSIAAARAGDLVLIAGKAQRKLQIPRPTKIPSTTGRKRSRPWHSGLGLIASQEREGLIVYLTNAFLRPNGFKFHVQSVPDAQKFPATDWDPSGALSSWRGAPCWAAVSMTTPRHPGPRFSSRMMAFDLTLLTMVYAIGIFPAVRHHPAVSFGLWPAAVPAPGCCYIVPRCSARDSRVA